MAWQVLFSVLLGLAINECSELSPWCARKLVRWSARCWYTDAARADTRAEELSALIDDRPGKLFKLITAMGFAAAGVTISVRRAVTRRHSTPGEQQAQIPADSVPAALIDLARRRGNAGVAFWSSLDPAERRAFASVAQERTFAQGARLMREGDLANHVVVILRGRTQVSMQQHGGERVIAERGPGQLIGERAALQLNVRSATVTALEKVHTLVMNTDDFAAFIRDHPSALDIIEQQVYDRLAQEPARYGQVSWLDTFRGPSHPSAN